jgi:hypothetical protein
MKIRHITLLRAQALACVLASAGLGIPAAGTASSSLRENALTHLLPVDGAALAQATTAQEAVSVVARTLPSAADVMSAAFYARIVELATTGSTGTEDANPLAGGAAAGARSVPFGQWFLVGVRIVPCGNPTSLPTAWLLAPGDVPGTPQGRALEALCVPQVRLVAQAFGVRREEDPTTGVFRPRGASDDKTLHLVFDVLPGVSEAEGARITAFGERVERDVVKAATEAANGGILTPSDINRIVARSVKGALSDSGGEDVLARLASARRALVSLAASVAPAPTAPGGAGAPVVARDGTLRENVEDARARPLVLADAQGPLRSALRGALLRDARLRHVTLNFSNSGNAARPGDAWLFARIMDASARDALPPASILKETDARILARFGKVGLKTLAWEQRDDASRGARLAAREIDAGAHEVFLPVPGRPASVDAEILKSARNDSFIARALVLAGFSPFFSDDGAGLTSADALETEWAEGRPGPATDTLAVVTGGLFSPSVHGPGSATCAACHAATGARERYLGNDAWPSATPGTPLRDNASRVNFGHARFNEMWNLRMLGWFERAPAVADRVVLETRADVRYANALLSGEALP